MIWFSRVLIPLAVNAGEVGKLACSLCSTDGRNDLHTAPLFALSHSLCHFAIPSFISSVAIVIFVVFSYSTFNSAASAAAAFASLPVHSLLFLCAIMSSEKASNSPGLCPVK